MLVIAFIPPHFCSPTGEGATISPFCICLLRLKFRQHLIAPAKRQGQAVSIDPLQLAGPFYPLHHTQLPEVFGSEACVYLEIFANC